MNAHTAAPLAPALEYRDLSFSYPGAQQAVLSGTSARIPQGAFCVITGSTGSGKSTLLRLAKAELAPAGTRGGEVLIDGRPASELARQESASAVAYVFQNPESQIVCERVWEEMAFGLENLGMPPQKMRTRIAETCSYLGISPWYHAQTSELSGGQRQTLALAASLALRPRLLLLDEPSSRLDPVAERSFLALLFQLNRELGLTVVLATHSPEAMVPYATMWLKLEGGKLLEYDGPAPQELKEPTMRVQQQPGASHGSTQKQQQAEASHSSTHEQSGAFQDMPKPCSLNGSIPTLTMNDVWQRYTRSAPWVLRGCSLKLYKGEIHALVGANAAGKSTILSLIAGQLRVARGCVNNELRSSQVLLPQQVKALLSRESVEEELMAWAPTANYHAHAAYTLLEEIGLSQELLARHPYDLSGGQQQLLALAKLLLCNPRLLLLDEPTQGLDRTGRHNIAQQLQATAKDGASILLATHDMQLVKAIAHRVSFVFDGQIVSSEPCNAFFEHSWLYR